MLAKYKIFNSTTGEYVGYSDPYMLYSTVWYSTEHSSYVLDHLPITNGQKYEVHKFVLAEVALTIEK